MRRTPTLEVDPALLLSRAEQEDMLVQWKPYACKMAGKYYARHMRWGTCEDFETAAMEGLWRAAQRFQPSKGFKFCTYATWWIKQCLSRFRMHSIGAPCHWAREGKDGDLELLSKAARRGSLSADRIAGRDGKSSVKLSDAIPAKDERPDYRFPDDFWERVNKWIQPRHQEVIRLRFREGLNLEDAGKVLGITRERVRQIEGKALKMIGDRVDFGDCLQEL